MIQNQTTFGHVILGQRAYGWQADWRFRTRRSARRAGEPAPDGAPNLGRCACDHVRCHTGDYHFGHLHRIGNGEAHGPDRDPVARAASRFRTAGLCSGARPLLFYNFRARLRAESISGILAASASQNVCDFIFSK